MEDNMESKGKNTLNQKLQLQETSHNPIVNRTLLDIESLSQFLANRYHANLLNLVTSSNPESHQVFISCCRNNIEELESPIMND